YDQWMDWGVHACNGSGIIGGFTFGYASNALTTTLGGPGAAFALAFEDGATGFGAFGSEVVSFSFTAMPASPTVPMPQGGGTSWIVDVKLIGGFEFDLDLGPFGFSWLFADCAPGGGGTGATGPLLVYVGSYPNKDAFDWYNPPPPSTASYLGTFDFGGPPFDFASW